MARTRWLGWVIGACAAGIGAFALGLAGLFGSPAAQPTSVSVLGAIPHGAAGLDCPEGEAVTRLLPGDRVFVTARSEDSGWLAVRSAAEGYGTVWVAASGLSVDGGADLGFLPVDGCLTPTPAPVQP